ncbi:MAG: HlyD family efflux transporter periplasmic adaptor subunit [Flavobacteriales bacterium]|nr:HlyD family efflux transporter periplasmic adaptor subunit [Flavobacteriales bacterium]
MKKATILYTSLLISSLWSCETTEDNFDASGSFEVDERIISAETNGKILDLTIEEGDTLTAGQVIGHIDATQLEIQAQQIEASINAINQKKLDAEPQIQILRSQLITQTNQHATLQEQIKVLDKEVHRFTNLVKANAVPQKQLDDLIGQKKVLEKQLIASKSQINVINSQIKSARENVQISNRSITSEIPPNKKHLDLIKNQINDATITTDLSGTVTSKLAFEGEFATIGKPLYKIANLNDLYLKVYITGNQLAQIKLNDAVTIMTDDGKGGYRKQKGKIVWISQKAEFTPKTIQTKDERANLVYAIKVKVKNEGFYKIGMYGQIKF